MNAPNPSYIQVRQDMMDLVSRPWTRLLDVGCAQGATASALRDAQGQGTVCGIELDESLATLAKERLDEVLVMDAVEALETLVSRGEKFDLVLCGDVLEHLTDPWKALSLIRELCTPEAEVVISLPNVAHYSTMIALLRQRWPYEDRGVHDRTHLRWFAPKNLNELYEGAGFKEEKRKLTRRIIERPHPLNKKFEPLISVIPILRSLTIFQCQSRLRPR